MMTLTSTMIPMTVLVQVLLQQVHCCSYTNYYPDYPDDTELTITTMEYSQSG